MPSLSDKTPSTASASEWDPPHRGGAGFLFSTDPVIAVRAHEERRERRRAMLRRGVAARAGRGSHTRRVLGWLTTALSWGVWAVILGELAFATKGALGF